MATGLLHKASVGVPAYDYDAFAGWLRRWRDAEKLQWKEIAERSGLNRGTIMTLAGYPGSATVYPKAGQAPSATTIAKLAYGLGLEVGYVMEKAGLATVQDSRWRNFSTAERNYIARALHEFELRHALEGALDPANAEARVPAPEGRKLTEELEAFLDE